MSTNMTKKPETIEKEMAVTRSRIDETVDEIGQRVSPDALKSAAKQNMTRARKYVESEAGRRMDGATTRVVEVGSSAKSAVRRHPVVTALIGIGLGMLLSIKGKHKNRGHRGKPIINKHY